MFNGDDGRDFGDSEKHTERRFRRLQPSLKFRKTDYYKYNSYDCVT